MAQPRKRENMIRQLKVIDLLLNSTLNLTHILVHFPEDHRTSIHNQLKNLQVHSIVEQMGRSQHYLYRIKDRYKAYKHALYLEDLLLHLEPTHYEMYQRKDANGQWLLYPNLDEESTYV